MQEFDFKGQVRRTYFANEIEPQACVRLNDQGWIVADTFHKRVAFFNEKGGREIDLPIPPGVELHPLGLALASDGLLAVSNYSTAEIYLFRRLDSNTDLNSEVHSALSLGRLHWDRKQWHEAEAAFTEAIRFDPNNAEAYHRRAGCRVNTKRVADSLPDFDAAVRLDPKNPEVVKNRGIALLNMLRFDDAVRDLKSAIDLGPTDPQPYRKVLGQVYAQRAVETGKGKKWPEAITDMDEAIKLDPTNADYFDKRGSLRFNLRHFKEAAADFTEAVRLAPTTPDYHLHLEWANARKPK